MIVIEFSDRCSITVYQRDLSINFSCLITFRLNDWIVFPHNAKFSPLNLVIAQMTKDKDMTVVLPDLMDPSQIIPSLSLYGELSVHHVRTIFCFSENPANLNNALRFNDITCFRKYIFRTVIQCIYESIIFVIFFCLIYINRTFYKLLCSI